MSKERKLDDKDLSKISGGSHSEVLDPGGGKHTSPEDPPIGGADKPSGEAPGGSGPGDLQGG